MNPYTHTLDTEGTEVQGCGTAAGHAWHRRQGTPMCEPCRAARAESDHDRREAKRDGVPHAKPATVQDILAMDAHRALRRQLQDELGTP